MSHKNRKAPELTTSEAHKKHRTSTTTPLYHETRPSTYPRQFLRRGRSGGWVLTRLDGYGKKISRAFSTRAEALTLLDVFGSLTNRAADTVIGGVA